LLWHANGFSDLSLAQGTLHQSQGFGWMACFELVVMSEC
jgi:hypothetical protein